MDSETDRILTFSKVIAVVGCSSKPQRAGHYVPVYLKAAGYRIIPVNPNLHTAIGERAYPDLPSIAETVNLVLIFQRSDKVPAFVDQAIAMGAQSVWMQQGIGNEAAAATARAAGLDVVQNACMMVEHRRWV